MNIRTLLAATALLLAACATMPTGSAAENGEWKLKWKDEFNEDGMPDEDKWTYEQGFVRNRELQYYTKARRKNARVEDGCLVITARKEKYENPAHDPDKEGWQHSREHADYTSASVTTKGKASWTHGRIEVRARLPRGRGVWPAIWTLGTNIDDVGWPECGEIDIMEYVGHKPHTIHCNVHTDKYNHVEGTSKGSTLEVREPWKDFHVYAIEWTPEKLKFFVDDTHYFTFRNEGTGAAAWPFDRPQYLILNIAIGGSWGGAEGVNPNIFPQQMLVDYVRVYQKTD